MLGITYLNSNTGFRFTRVTTVRDRARRYWRARVRYRLLSPPAMSYPNGVVGQAAATHYDLIVLIVTFTAISQASSEPFNSKTLFMLNLWSGSRFRLGASSKPLAGRLPSAYASDIGIDSARAGDLVAARHVSVTLDVFVYRRALVAASAGRPSGPNLVA